MSISQLFVGRLSKSCRLRDVEDRFNYYGNMTRCEVKYGSGMAYAFVDYSDKRDAEDAIKGENGKEMFGNSIVVEWARGPKRGFRDDESCYNCGRRGHFARDCRDRDYRGGGGGGGGYRGGGYRSSGYSSYRDRSRSRSRDRDRGRYKRRSRSRSGSRSRSRSRSPDRRRRSYSRSPKRASRSPSPRKANGDASP